MMNGTPAKLGSNAHIHEIVSHVKHHYPNLGPALQQAIEKLQDASEVDKLHTEIEELKSWIEEHKAGIQAEAEELIEQSAKGVCCQHCGSQLHLNIKSLTE